MISLTAAKTCCLKSAESLLFEAVFLLNLLALTLERIVLVSNHKPSLWQLLLHLQFRLRFQLHEKRLVCRLLP